MGQAIALVLILRSKGQKISKIIKNAFCFTHQSIQKTHSSNPCAKLPTEVRAKATWPLLTRWGQNFFHWAPESAADRRIISGSAPHPTFGTRVWKTFKSLRSETSDRRQMDRKVFKSIKNVILWEFYQCRHSIFTGLVILDFCEGYVKDNFLFLKKFERKTWPIFGSIIENLHGPKIELFPLRRV